MPLGKFKRGWILMKHITKTHNKVIICEKVIDLLECGKV